jgi:hypothetical protein
MCTQFVSTLHYGAPSSISFENQLLPTVRKNLTVAHNIHARINLIPDPHEHVVAEIFDD